MKQQEIKSNIPFSLNNNQIEFDNQDEFNEFDGFDGFDGFDRFDGFNKVKEILNDIQNDIEQNDIEQNDIEQNNIEQNIEEKIFLYENSDENTDSDEYVDLIDMVKDETLDIYQFQINMDKLILKLIGKSSIPHDIIIKENFGPNSSMSLYNCIYTNEELDLFNQNETNKSNGENIDCSEDILTDLFFPIIKLVKVLNNIQDDNIENKQVNFVISSIAIKLKQNIVLDKEINEWELYWVQNEKNNDNIKTLKLEKNINTENILEKLLELSL
jgi:hypothetical protein